MFTKSEKIKLEYCAQIVKIGELLPIEGSDFLMKTNIGGAYQVVVGKNDVKTGDVMVYCKLETAINKDFLSVNNQFELGERNLNSNRDEVNRLMDEGKEDEVRERHLVGYFNKHGRVRIVKLRGCVSQGCLFSIDSLAKWNKKVLTYDFEQCFKPNEDGIVVPFEFDTIDGKLFIEAYVPEIQTPREKGLSRRERKRGKKIEKLDRMVEGQFGFHYDTGQLQDNLWRFTPDTVVDISVKEHGTSFICGNVLTKKFKEDTIARKMIKKKCSKKIEKIYKQKVNPYWGKDAQRREVGFLKEKMKTPFRIRYGEVTSSRGVIKNQYINKDSGRGFYSVDVWSEYGNLLFHYIPKGITVYGEIVGYVTGKSAMIQKGYDYGCKVGENMLMPYRITFTDADGNHTDWNVQEVYGWTLNLLKEHPKLKERIKPINILYHGRLGDLYPDLDVNNHWQEEVLKRLAEDKNFCMEEKEPMCKNKVPREGIVIRIENDNRPEAFKLKTVAFKLRESKEVDAGNVDIEMELGYTEN